MPVYNGERFLRESIESVLNQSFSDFEFIIINDGSKDNSLNIIKEYANKDNRIKIIDQKNIGVVGALNNGLKRAKGDYIARMDADDISELNRLEKQLWIIEKEKAFLCGTWANIIDENNTLQQNKLNYPPTTWNNIKLYLIRGNPFIHPSVLFSKKMYDKEKDDIGNLYRNFKHVEDYELWTRLVPKYRSVNIDEYLLKYRIHDNQITRQTNFSMKVSGIKIRMLGILRLIFY